MALVRPGINFNITSALPASGLPSDTGTGFMVCAAATGPTTKTLRVISIDDFVAKYGGRVSYSLGYDAADVFFNEGGSSLYVARYAGPAAAVDQVTLKDAATVNSIQVAAVGPGASGLSVAVVAGVSAGSYQLVISNTATSAVLEQTSDLLTPADAAAWSQSSNYVAVTAVGTVKPAVAAATALTGGADDIANATDTQKTAALALFTADLGPGQVFMPGATSDTARQALLAHAASTANRHALCDFADTATAATLASSATVLRGGVTDPSYGESFAPWAQIPGLMRGTVRVIPLSAAVAGLMARSDHLTGDPNMAAAGANGQFRYVIGVTQTYSDADRGTLNTAGVNVAKLVRTGSASQGIRMYGARTLADPVNFPSWSTAGASRLRMAIEADCKIIGQDFIFSQLDGQGSTISSFHGRLTEMLMGYWKAGALYGATAAEAFLVDTSGAVNTPTTLANNQLNATLAVRISGMAEMIVFNITPVPVNQSLAA